MTRIKILTTGQTGASRAASATSVTPAGNIAATNVQAALEELDAEKQPLDSDLTAIAALSTQSFGRSLLTQASASAARTTLGVDYTTIAADTALTSRFASSKRGIWRPQGWGANLRAAVQTSQPVITIVGDSIGRGTLATNLGPTSSNTSWAGKLRTYLQGLYGDGGSGIHDTRENLTSQPGSAYSPMPVVLTGTWSNLAYDDGPCAGGMQSNATNSTMTTTVRGSIVRVYYIRASGAGSMDVSIDGGASVSVNTAGSAGVGIYEVTGLANTTHTIQLTKTGGAEYVYILAFSGTNATGLIVNNCSRSGGKSTQWDSIGQTWGPAGQWAGGNLMPADLVIYAVGVNDAAANVTADTYEYNVRRYLTCVLDPVNAAKHGGAGINPTTPDAKAGAVDVMFHMPHVGKYEGTGELYHAYIDRVRGLAETYGAALVDEWTIYRNSWNYFNSLGGWGSSAAPGASGTDPVHPSDVGHNLYYLNVKAVIDEALAYTG